MNPGGGGYVPLSGFSGGGTVIADSLGLAASVQNRAKCIRAHRMENMDWGPLVRISHISMSF